MGDGDDKKPGSASSALKAPKLPRVPLVLDLTDVEASKPPSAPPRGAEIEGYSPRPTPPPSALRAAPMRQRRGPTAKWPPERRGDAAATGPVSRRKLRGDTWVEPSETVDESVLGASLRAMAELPESKRGDAALEREPPSKR
jgi:hypothetical protein